MRKRLARLLHLLEFRLRVWRCMLLGQHRRIERPAQVLQDVRTGKWGRIQHWICEGTCGVGLVKTEIIDSPEEVSSGP